MCHRRRDAVAVGMRIGQQSGHPNRRHLGGGVYNHRVGISRFLRVADRKNLPDSQLKQPLFKTLGLRFGGGFFFLRPPLSRRRFPHSRVSRCKHCQMQFLTYISYCDIVIAIWLYL